MLGRSVAVDVAFDSLHTLTTYVVSTDSEKVKLLSHGQILEEVVLEAHLQGEPEDGHEE